MRIDNIMSILSICGTKKNFKKAQHIMKYITESNVPTHDFEVLYFNYCAFIDNINERGKCKCM